MKEKKHIVLIAGSVRKNNYTLRAVRYTISHKKHHNRRQRKFPRLIDREVVNIFNINYFTIDQARGFGVAYYDVFYEKWYYMVRGLTL